MFFEENDLGPAESKESAFDLLQELERNTPEEIRQQRTRFRVAVKAKVALQPGNASELLKYKVQGVSGDVSEGGCRILFPTPVAVGDVYRLAFDRTAFDLPLTFARCLRCRLLREDAFEAGFQFFSPIALPDNVQVPASQA